MLNNIIGFAIGLVLLIKGGDWFVDGAAAIAKRFRVPDLIIGATVVSIGTTIPEVMVSAQSALMGHGEIAYGNAVGSVICNTCLIAAITLAFRPSEIRRDTISQPVTFFFIAAAAYAGAAYLGGKFTRVTGFCLLVIFFIYMVTVLSGAVRASGKSAGKSAGSGGVSGRGGTGESSNPSAKIEISKPSGREEISELSGTGDAGDISVSGGISEISGLTDVAETIRDEALTAKDAGCNKADNKADDKYDNKADIRTDDMPVDKAVGKADNDDSLARLIIMMVIGALLIAVGADLLVDNGTEIARILGVSEAVIGLTLVALGTSLPEFVTAITSLVKGHSSLSLGNVIGANLFNLVLVSGISAFLSPFGIPASSYTMGINTSLVVDIPVMIAAMLILCVPAMHKERLYRAQGIILLLIYAGFCIFQFT